MALSVTTIDPAGASSNIPINKVITVTFTISGGATGIDTTTLIPANFALRHSKSNMVIRTTITWDNPVAVAGGYTQKVYITPITLLSRNSSYTLRIVGYDANNLLLSVVKDSGGTSLAGITQAVFTTGDDIQTNGSDKTDTEQQWEGDVRLPSSVKVTSSARFQLVGATPYDRAWGFTGNTIQIEFNRDVSGDTVTGSVEIMQHEFMDEAGWFAQKITEGAHSGQTLFEWQSESMSDLPTGISYNPPSWSISVNGRYLNIVRSGNPLYNTRYEVYIYNTLKDNSENYLESDYYFTFTGESFPSMVTPRTIKVEIPTVFEHTNMDFVHELIWKHSINAFRMTGRNLSQFSSDGGYLRNFIKTGVILDIMYDLMLHSTLMAGQRKMLGDFEIEYDVNAGNIGKDSVVARYEKKMEEYKRAIVMRGHMPRVFMKGLNSAMDPPNFRQRLWANPRILYNNFPYKRTDLRPVANTRAQRDATLPGYYDTWS